MSKAKLVYFTEVQAYLKPEVAEALKETEQYSPEFFENLGIGMPKGSEVTINKEDLEFFYYDGFCPGDEIRDVVDLDEDEGAILTYKNGDEIRIVEDSWDIASQVEYNALSKIEKLIEKIKIKFNKR